MKRKKSRSKLMEDMYAFVDICVVLAEENPRMGSVESLAEAAGISPQTIYRLQRRKTRYPRFMTVQLIGLAVGLDLLYDASTGKLRMRFHPAA